MPKQRRIIMSEAGYVAAGDLARSRMAETIVRDLTLPDDAPVKIKEARSAAVLGLLEITEYLHGRIACR